MRAGSFLKLQLVIQPKLRQDFDSSWKIVFSNTNNSFNSNKRNITMAVVE